ncbi:MAG: caspase family protein, partial [Myxococcaceae bacterium]|nr:caspase family protein [Myxococcaceae bacterium]
MSRSFIYAVPRAVSPGRTRVPTVPLLAFAAVLVLCAPRPAAALTRRFAIVLGNNAGAEGHAPLRFAETDATRFARVLTELGDVSADDLFLFTGGTVAQVEAAVREVRARIDQVHRAPDTRAVVLFYFSGHSDGEALELGRERLSFPTLKALLGGTGAELKVAVIDACRSGSAVREKGGRPAPGFQIRLADQLTARGEVYITSSAQDEASLESSEVMGSYFTDNLISGLRGAADTSGDRQVTLAEAYRYAYDRTVSATAISPAGAQHPAYDYQLQGTGELVLSSLIRAASTLALPDGADRAVVTDLTRDQVVAELLPGSAREIALADGIYGVRLLRAGQTYGGRFRIEKGTRYAVRWEDLEALELPEVARKGGPMAIGPRASKPVRRGLRPMFSFALGAAPAATPAAGMQGVMRLSYEPTPKTGLSLALVASGGSAFIRAVSETTVGIRIGYRAGVQTERFHFSLGAEVGASNLWIAEDDGTHGELGLVAGPRAVLRVRVGGPAWLGVEGEAPFTLVGERGGWWAAWTPAV